MQDQPVALVTGGSRGIGAAICRKLAADGYKVIVNYCRSRDAAEKLASEIDGTAIKANLSSDKDITILFDRIKKDFGHLDILVNNAGIAEELDTIHEVSHDLFQKIMQVNLWATVLCTQKACQLIETGTIICISSVCAKKSTPYAISYAMSKAGVESFMRSTAKTLAPTIRINIVAPGTTDTDMMHNNATEDEIAQEENRLPMCRVCQPDDIAEMVSFLASEKAKNITGQVFTVDAGEQVL